MSNFSQNVAAKDNLTFSYIKGLIISLLLSFALVVLFAFLIKWISAIEGYIYVGTMVIKAVSSGLGAAVAVKGESRGLVKGVLFGLLYISLAFLVFSFLAGSFTFDSQTVLDFVASAIVGGIVGIIKVNKN